MALVLAVNFPVLFICNHQVLESSPGLISCTSQKTGPQKGFSGFLKN
jgi:hypothetical protein